MYMATNKSKKINIGFFKALHSKKNYFYAIALNSGLKYIFLLMLIFPIDLNLVQGSELFRAIYSNYLESREFYHASTTIFHN